MARLTDEELSGSTFATTPSILVAADNHNVANGDTSWSEAISNGISHATDFATAAVLSGANDFHNTGAAISNFLGGDMEERRTQDVIEEYDSDLGQYYKANKTAVDTVGFIGGSFIPGLGALKGYSAGAKALNAVKAGRIGMNLEEATGLLKVTQWEALQAAKTEMVSSNATFNILSGNTLKAVAAGFGEQAIQGAVFETAVAATMFKSPVMEEMDASDVASNILFGAVLGGGIGGVLEGAASYGFLRKAKSAADIALQPVTHISEMRAGATQDQRIIMWADDKFNTPSDVTELDNLYGGKATKNRDAKIATINDKIRTSFNDLANGDSAVGNLVTDHISTLESTEAVGDGILGLRNITRVADKNPTESVISSITKKIAAGTATSEEVTALDTVKVSFTKLWGEGVGNQLDELPKGKPAIQDTLRKGESIQVSQKGIKIGNSNFQKVSLDEKKPWDIATASQAEAEARYLHTLFSASLDPKAIIPSKDLPFLEKAYAESVSSPSVEISIKHTDGSIEKITSRSDLFNHIVATKDALVQELGVLDGGTTVANSAELARRLNMRVAAVEKSAVDSLSKEDLYLANQSFAKEHSNRMQKAGVPISANPYDILLKPQHVKMGYDTTAIKDVDGNVLEGIAAIKQKQVIYRAAAEKTFASAFGATAAKFFRMPEDVTLKATTEGAGAGFNSFANGTYDSPASHFERIGAATHNLITERANTVHLALEPHLQAIAKDLDATLELSTILNKVRMTPEKYVLNEEGTGLILRGLKNQTDKKPYVKGDANAADEILIKNESVQAFISQHIATNGERVSKFQAFRNQVGLQDRTDPNTFYAPPVDPKRYPHFAFVVDESVTGTGHVKMIHAATERELDLLASKVPTEGGLKVRFKNDTERFHQAYGDYLADSGLHENYIDSALHRSGVSAQYFPVTDGKKLTDDIMNWHVQKERQLVREGVSTLYSKEFEEFRNLGDQYTRLATSKYGRLSMAAHAEESIKNPYVDYIKTALDIGKGNDSRLWTPLNAQLDQKISNAWNSITGTLLKTKSPEELLAVNTAMQDAGIKTAVYDAMLDGLANHTAPRGVLSSFVQKANALLASITLRPDVLNAVNNIVGSVVLTGTEMRAVLAGIEKGDAAAVGELASIAKVRVPGTQHDILSPTKLVSQAIKNWSDPLIRETAFRDGFTSRHSMEYQSIVDELSLKGSESVSELNARIKNAYEKTMKVASVAEKLSGNKFAEEFTRFISADVMRQITDVAVKHGTLEPALAKSYIQTFVNRTQGNYLASQRPLMFSGPVGQAIGLFQTYQFNLIQQLLRHVAEGNGKNAAMMMGLQGSVYGMHGLPAFDVINTHLVGNAAGNSEHHDLITTAYGALGKEGADWLVYGGASNVLGLLHPDLKMNLYTRGDINPRQLSIIPTNPADVPIINASTKFFGNLAETMGKLASGHSNPMVTVLQGLEHNGVNRPLAGLAQTLEAFSNPELRSFSTTNSGNLSASNDLLTLTNFGRILGAKPMDEAITIDAGFRKSVYQASDAARRSKLGEVVKSTLIGGKNPNPDDLHYFMSEYAKTGGKQENFNKYMVGLYKSANTAQANEIAKALKTPYAKGMQEIMGGKSMLDFSQQAPSSTQTSEE